MLSERIRPDVEAAPWVVDAVKKLEQRVKYFSEALEQYGRHMPDCTWITPLPTGRGFFGCTCGLDAIRLEAETPLIF